MRIYILTAEDCSFEEAREAAAYSGSFYVTYYKVEVEKTRKIPRKYCMEKGYTEKQLKPIIKKEIKGWE